MAATRRLKSRATMAVLQHVERDCDAREEKEKETKFSHVLQPIRDITKNWNIDIASELEEYLHEVTANAYDAIWIYCLQDAF